MQNAVIIHIGYPKTATTWLQKEFFPNVTNWNYLPPGIFNEQIIKIDPFDPNLNFDEWKEKDRLIVSNENFIGLGRTNGFIKIGLANRLKSIFPDAKIVIFIRNQLDMIASSYNWNVKRMGCNLSPKKFLNFTDGRPNQISMYKLFHNNYYEIIKLYSELFGKENVYVFLFEDFQRNPEKFINNFCKTFDFQTSDKTLDFAPVNSKLRKGLFFIIRMLNLFTQPKILYRHHFISFPYFGRYLPGLAERLNKYKIFGTVPNTKEILGKDLTNKLSEYYKPFNKQLTLYLDKEKLREYGYPV
ncbi:MAG: sulfotransferase domain-containing protein [Bacteroidales bacterium]